MVKNTKRGKTFTQGTNLQNSGFKQTLALFSNNPENSDQAIQHLAINKHRLAEIYFFYSEWDFEGLIKND